MFRNLQKKWVMMAGMVFLYSAVSSLPGTGKLLAPGISALIAANAVARLLPGKVNDKNSLALKLAVLQSCLIAVNMRSNVVLAAASMIVGSLMILWLSEKIGYALLVTAAIVARIPVQAASIIKDLDVSGIAVVLGMFTVLTAIFVYVREVYIPVNIHICPAGIMPVVLASVIISLLPGMKNWSHPQNFADTCGLFLYVFCVVYFSFGLKISSPQDDYTKSQQAVAVGAALLVGISVVPADILWTFGIDVGMRLTVLAGVLANTVLAWLPRNKKQVEWKGAVWPTFSAAMARTVIVLFAAGAASVLALGGSMAGVLAGRLG